MKKVTYSKTTRIHGWVMLTEAVAAEDSEDSDETKDYGEKILFFKEIDDLKQ